MSTSGSGYVEFVKDQLTSLRGVSIGRFFGGIGLSFGGTQFAMIMGSTLYFVVDDSTRLKYERMGSDCFSYSTKKGRVEVRKYYAVPAEVIEEQEQIVALAQESIRIASLSKRSPTSRSSTTRPKRRAV
jgi:DNA transformation protein and related proteins